MSDFALRAESPVSAVEPPVVVIQPARGLASLQLRAVWQYRELLFACQINRRRDWFLERPISP